MKTPFGAYAVQKSIEPLARGDTCPTCRQGVLTTRDRKAAVSWLFWIGLILLPVFGIGLILLFGALVGIMLPKDSEYIFTCVLCKQRIAAKNRDIVGPSPTWKRVPD